MSEDEAEIVIHTEKIPPEIDLLVDNAEVATAKIEAAGASWRFQRVLENWCRKQCHSLKPGFERKFELSAQHEGVEPEVFAGRDIALNSYLHGSGGGFFFFFDVEAAGKWCAGPGVFAGFKVDLGKFSRQSPAVGIKQFNEEYAFYLLVAVEKEWAWKQLVFFEAAQLQRHKSKAFFAAVTADFQCSVTAIGIGFVEADAFRYKQNAFGGIVDGNFKIAAGKQIDRVGSVAVSQAYQPVGLQKGLKKTKITLFQRIEWW